MINKEIIQTADGSSTIFLPDWDEHFHSIHGAIQEANHVYIENGFFRLESLNPINILEIGFGTGLNAFLTFYYGTKKGQMINYTALEGYPLTEEIWQKLNYSEVDFLTNYKNEFTEIHRCNWHENCAISKEFLLEKREMFFQDFDEKSKYDLIYYDAFGFRVQPELWSLEMFQKMYDSLNPKGILVTYASRKSIKRHLENVGFSVEILKGPPGKREMTRATKTM